MRHELHPRLAPRMTPKKSVLLRHLARQVTFYRTAVLLTELMCSTRLNRSADQSSSMATARTVSKPASFNRLQPVSRLKSHWYFFDAPLE